MRLTNKTLTSSIAALAVGAGLLLAAPQAQAATSPRTGSTTQAVQTAAKSKFSAPVTGSFTDASGAQGVFAGTFTPTKFAAGNGTVIATGTLTGTLTDAAGTVLGTATKTVSTPIVAGQGAKAAAVTPAASCQILDLRLQPLDLNLLGLVVHTDTIHLNITAQSGPGNLLGNLLCAVTGLLNGGNLGAQLAALLNQILSILNGL
jgi:hypothetical protein